MTGTTLPASGVSEELLEGLLVVLDGVLVAPEGVLVACELALDKASSTPGGNCGSNPSRSSTVTFTSPGADPTKYDKSLVYSVLAARAATSAMMSSSSGLVESWNGYVATPDKLTGAAAYVIDDDTRTITWNVSSTCYNTANVILAVQRVTAP